MKFVRSGKKAARERQAQAKREALIDHAVAAVRLATHEPGLCLPMCVLLERVLRQVLPTSRFVLRLGATTVVPLVPGVGDPIVFDPRSPKGVDGGFHAWLEESNGELLDPSILLTLAAHGYEVDPESYFLGGGRDLDRDGFRFVYEEVPELELLGVAESEPHLARMMAVAMTGVPQPPGTIYLDVAWRGEKGQSE